MTPDADAAVPLETLADDYVARIERYALTLAQIGTPAAIEAGNALVDALRGMATALNLTAAAFDAALPTKH